MYIYIYIYFYDPKGQDTIKSIFFPLNAVGLDSDFSFSYTGYQAKEINLPMYLPIDGVGKRWMYYLCREH